MGKPTFYRKSKFYNVKYSNAHTQVSRMQIMIFIANEITKVRKQMNRDVIFERLEWMDKSRLLSIFYMINKRDAGRALNTFS